MEANLQCLGCGAQAPSFPWVGVGASATAVVVEAALARGASADEIVKLATARVAAPVCDKCHRDPAHRTRPLKVHFYAADTVVPPESSTLGMPAVEGSAAANAPGLG